MGCDITMHSQVKDPQGRWVWYDKDIYDQRNYTLFGILSGARDHDVEYISKLKGYPEDSSDKLRPFNGWDPDDVTESGVYIGYAGTSYLNLTEIRSYDWTEMQESTFVKEVIPYLEAVAEKYGGPDNVRIIFGYSC